MVRTCTLRLGQKMASVNRRSALTYRLGKRPYGDHETFDFFAISHPLGLPQSCVNCKPSLHGSVLQTNLVAHPLMLALCAQADTASCHCLDELSFEFLLVTFFLHFLLCVGLLLVQNQTSCVPCHREFSFPVFRVPFPPIMPL